MKEWISAHKQHALIIFSLFVILLMNTRLITPQRQDIYFSFMISISLVIFALIANGAYYSSRVLVQPSNLAIAFFTFMLIANYLIAVIGHEMGYSYHHDYIAYFMAMGRANFIVGIILADIKKDLASTSHFRAKHLFLLAVIIIGMELLVLALLIHLDMTLSSMLFLINATIGAALMVHLLNRWLEDTFQDSKVQFIYYFLIFLTQVSVSLLPSTYMLITQVHTVLAISLIGMFTEINHANFIRPEISHRKLQNQFDLYAKNLMKIIDKKTLQVRAINENLIADIEYAKKVQQSMLPSPKMHFRDVKIVSEYFPCERLSGDFYDVYRIDDDNIALYFLDVAGHGVSAALLTMFSSNYLKSNDQNIQRFRGLKPEKNLEHFYAQFNVMNFPDELHLVIFYATYNLNTRTLTYCTGGMNCVPICFKPSGRHEFLDESKGFTICKMGDFYTPEFVSAKITLDKGDRLLFYTDGLIDEEKNKIFNLDSLIAFYKKHSDKKIHEINALLVEDIQPYKEVLNDDITYIFMEI